MKIVKTLWILPAVAVVFALSMYFSRKKIEERKTENDQKFVVVDAATPEPIAKKPVPLAASKPFSKLGPSETSRCVIQEEFKKEKRELGKIVNSDIDQHSPTFTKLIEEFRLSDGLPLPIALTSEKLDQENIVYNNCRSTCHGSVHEVFVSQVIKGQFIEVLQKDGTLKKLPLHESGLEVASVDELNRKGVPFRSWLAPVSENDWYIKDKDLYYSLDISGLWLKISPSSKWEIIPTPEDLQKLKLAEEPLKIPGCNNEEQCLTSGTRHFKAPRICQ